MSRVPIRLLLTAGFSVAMALVLASTGVFLYVRLSSALDRTLNVSLRSRAQDVAALVQQSDSGLREGRRIGLLENGESFAQVLTRSGSIVDTTPQLGEGPILTPAQLARVMRSAVTFERGPVGATEDRSRMLAVPVTAQDTELVVVVGASLEARDEALAGLRTQLTIGGPLALLLASAVGYALAASALRPVEAMRRRASVISGANAGERLPVARAQDELRRLGETLNEMLARIDTTVSRERRFVADASHELRTPLALLRTELELAGRPHRTRDELAGAIQSATEEVHRLTHLAEDLLVLARADDGNLPIREETITTYELLSGLAIRFAEQAGRGGRAIEVVGPDVKIAGDRLRLQQAVGNLIDNALVHGAGTVRLSVVVTRDMTEIHVSDEGQGFQEGFLPRAFERFSRADEVRGRGGTGLGLAIVDVIAQAHGGSCGVGNLHPHGADVWIALPLRVQ